MLLQTLKSYPFFKTQMTCLQHGPGHEGLGLIHLSRGIYTLNTWCRVPPAWYWHSQVLPHVCALVDRKWVWETATAEFRHQQWSLLQLFVILLQWCLLSFCYSGLYCLVSVVSGFCCCYNGVCYQIITVVSGFLFCYSGAHCHFVTVVSVVILLQWCLLLFGTVCVLFCYSGVCCFVTVVSVVVLIQWCLLLFCYSGVCCCFVTVVPIVVSLQWCLLLACYSGVCCPLVTVGKTANCCIVMARLITKGHDHGMHPFLLQIRDLDTHQPLAGQLLDLSSCRSVWTGVKQGDRCWEFTLKSVFWNCCRLTSSILHFVRSEIEKKYPHDLKFVLFNCRRVFKMLLWCTLHTGLAVPVEL